MWLKKDNPYFDIISTNGMKRGQWLEERRKGIGGSDAAAILGVSHYGSPYSIWADKMGYYEDKDNEGIRQGRDLEDYVARRFAEERNTIVRRVNYILVSKKYPWMRANIDRRVYGSSEGQFIGLECKTSKDIYLSKFKNGEYPIEYYTQCMHYMAVTGAPRWYLAVLVFGTDFMVFEIERDEEDVQQLVEAEKSFWENYVLTGVQPPTDGTQATTEALKRVYPSQNSSGVKATIDEGALESLWIVKSQIKQMERKADEFANVIKAEIGNAEGIAGLEYSASWKVQTKTSVDGKALKKACVPATAL